VLAFHTRISLETVTVVVLSVFLWFKNRIQLKISYKLHESSVGTLEVLGQDKIFNISKTE
jgi:hypothetical protein